MTAALTNRSHATPKHLHARQQQHGKRRTEILEDRADHEVEMGRDLAMVSGASDPPRHSDPEDQEAHVVIEPLA